MYSIEKHVMLVYLLIHGLNCYLHNLKSNTIPSIQTLLLFMKLRTRACILNVSHISHKLIQQMMIFVKNKNKTKFSLFVNFV